VGNGNKLRNRRNELGLTLEQVGDMCGVSKTTVRKWETGAISNMRRDKVVQLAKALKVDISFILDEYVKEHPPTGVRIPVYGEVAAGTPIEAITDIVDYEEITESMARRGNYIALKIRGDSMEPRIYKGDIVIVRLQDNVETGELAIVTVNEESATCKKIKHVPGGIMLLSFNPDYDPQFFSNKQIEELPVKILGRVVENRSKY